QIDRYAEESLGYKTKEFPELICVEGRSNTDIGAGAFYKYGTTFIVFIRCDGYQFSLFLIGISADDHHF
ncbi:MAG: hypothetical protein UIC49_02430, partial [Paludibacteraceae bacterium]|nr:hypothetical protein [Paludibacteraceae bacterium]